MRTSWPGARLASGKMLRADSIMPRAVQVSAPARCRILRSVSPSPTRTTCVSRPSRSASVSSSSSAGLTRTVVLGAAAPSGLGAERQTVLAGDAVALRLGAGADHLRLDLGLLGLGDMLQHFAVFEGLAVLVGQDAAQQLDDVDGDVAVLRRVGFAVLAGVHRLRGVEAERIERGNLRLVVGRYRRQAPNDAHVGLGVDVFAPQAPLLHRLVDEVAHGDGAAGDLQAVALGRRPLEALAVAHEGHVAAGEVGLAELAEAGQEAAAALALVGRAVEDDENRNGADGAGEAGRDQPAETAALAALGVVGLVEVLERLGGTPAIELRQPRALPLRGSERSKASVRRVAAPIDHLALDLPPIRIAAALDSAAARFALVPPAVVGTRKAAQEYSNPPLTTRSNSPLRDDANSPIERHKPGGLMAAGARSAPLLTGVGGVNEEAADGSESKKSEIGACKFGTTVIDTPRPETTSRSGRSEKRQNAGRSKRPGWSSQEYLRRGVDNANALVLIQRLGGAHDASPPKIVSRHLGFSSRD